MTTNSYQKAPQSAEEARDTLYDAFGYGAHVHLFQLLYDCGNMAWDRAYLYVLSRACDDISPDLQAEVDALKWKTDDAR